MLSQLFNFNFVYWVIDLSALLPAPQLSYVSAALVPTHYYPNLFSIFTYKLNQLLTAHNTHLRQVSLNSGHTEQPKAANSGSIADT